MRTLQGRILLWLVPATVVALALTAGGIDQAVRGDLTGALDRTLRARARGLAAGVDLSVDGSFEFEPGEESLAEASRGFYAVLGEQGRRWAGSSGGPDPMTLPIAAGCTTLARPSGPVRMCSVTVEREPEADEEDIARWRKSHPGQPLPPPRARQFRVVIGQDTGSLEASLRAVRTRLAAGFSVLLGILVALPLWAVRRGLTPLRNLSAQADRVGPETASTRLDEAGTPSEVRSLVAALNRALDRLVGAYERQKRFSADAAHELRGPVSVIRTQCEVALRRPRDAGELRETVATVHRAALRLGSLVERLLHLSKLEAQGRIGELGTVDLAEIARETAAAHGPAAAAKGVSLGLDLPAPIPARGDAARLGECLSNLVANAIRYTPTGGRVTVESLAGGAPGIRVTDTGIGIPAEHLPRIFDRFYQVDPARSAADGGTGLGLAIARESARLHGGDITVESRPGEGSCFTLTLPATDP